MAEEEWLNQLEREIQRAPRPLRRLSDDERYERETERILKAEERMDAQEKLLSRLARMEHRIRRIEYFNKHQMKEVHSYTKETFELFIASIVIAVVLGGTYLVNKEMGNNLFSWVVAAAIVGYIVFVFVREMWRNRKPASSEE